MSRSLKLKALGVFELETGAILPDVRLELSKERVRNPFRGRWMKMASKAWLQLADAKLSSSASRVMYRMFYLLRDGNKIACRQEALAKDAGMHQPDVSAAIRELIAAKIIQRGNERGVYLLNPHIGFIGSGDQHAACVNAWDSSEQREAVA